MNSKIDEIYNKKLFINRDGELLSIYAKGRLGSTSKLVVDWELRETVSPERVFSEFKEIVDVLEYKRESASHWIYSESQRNLTPVRLLHQFLYSNT